MLLYGGAIKAVRDAERAFELGDIVSRGEAISKACLILTELSTSMDVGSGGELARRLLTLYEYIFRLLTQAHLEQNKTPLLEARDLLQTLESAWIGAARTGSESDAPHSPLEEVA